MNYRQDEYVLYLYPDANGETVDLKKTEQYFAKIIKEKDTTTNTITIELSKRKKKLEVFEDNLKKLMLNSRKHSTNQKWGEIFLEKLHFEERTIEPNNYKIYTKEDLLIIDFTAVNSLPRIIVSGFRLVKNYRINDNVSIEDFIDQNFNSELYNNNFPAIETFNDLINILEEEKLLPLHKDEIWRLFEYENLVEYKKQDIDFI